MTFKWKTICGIAIIEAIMLGLITWNAVKLLTVSNEKELLKRTITITQLFAASHKEAIIAYDIASLESFVNDVQEHSGIVYARIIGRDGVTLAQAGDTEALTRKFHADTLYGQVHDNVFDSFAEITVGRESFGRVEIGFSIKEIRDFIKSARNKILAIAAAEMTLTALFSYLLGTMLTKMIRQFTQGSREIGAGHLGYQIDVRGAQDLTEAALAFNHMSRQLAREIREHDRAECDKRMLEKKLLQAQKMEAIGNLASGIAHDFNNILVPILGHAELIEMALPVHSEQKENIQNIIAAVNRAKSLISQILIYSRQTEKELQVIQVTPIISESLKLLRSSLPSFIEIKQNIARDCCMISGNPVQIHQVIMNLCTNAYHAMKERGGILSIDMTNAYIDPENILTQYRIPPGKYLCLTVEDTGRGMNDTTMERIFEPYFTTKKQEEGTGLGLSVVHGIVSANNGYICVSSKPGVGSIFQLYFPCVAPNEKTEQSNNPGRPAKGKEHLLVIDDEPEILKINKDLLTLIGYRVTPVEDSDEALKIFRQQPDEFDLVITDMNMPRMSGADLSRILLKIRPDIPIILYTGFSEIINEEKALEIGIKKLLLKPLSMRELSENIRTVLDKGEEELSPAGERAAGAGTTGQG